MAKVRDLNLKGSRFFICDTCGKLYTGVVGLREGISCPGCGKMLLTKSELTRGDRDYDVDERRL